MATIPQNLQTAWDNASQALDDHNAAQAKLLDLQNQETAIGSALTTARQDESTKGSVLDQARLTFDQTADAILTLGTVTPPPPPTPALATPTPSTPAA